MAAVTVYSDFWDPENKACHYFDCFSSYLSWSDGAICGDLGFWMLSFKPAFSLSSFTFIKQLFSSLLYAIRVVSSAYLRLFSSRIFLPAILIPDWASFSLVFHMMYSACKLNKRSENIQPWYTAFPVLKQPIVPCLILTVASWLAYRFLRRQVRWSGIPITSRIFYTFLWSTQ